MKAHGNSQEKQIRTAILQCVGFYENDLKDKISAAIRKEKENSVKSEDGAPGAEE